MGYANHVLVVKYAKIIDKNLFVKKIICSFVNKTLTM